jgi:5'-nucleotidase
MVLKLTGALLRAALEHGLSGEHPSAHVSGLTVTYDPRRPPGDRILSMQLADGTTVHPDTAYSVTVTDFLATGTGDGYTALGNALASTPTGIVDLDALIQYIGTLPQPLHAPRDERMRAIDSNS